MRQAYRAVVHFMVCGRPAARDWPISAIASTRLRRGRGTCRSKKSSAIRAMPINDRWPEARLRGCDGPRIRPHNAQDVDDCICPTKTTIIGGCVDAIERGEIPRSPGRGAILLIIVTGIMIVCTLVRLSDRWPSAASRHRGRSRKAKPISS